MADPTVDPWQAVNTLGDPNIAIGIGGLGVVCALSFANLGAAFGTAKAGIAIVEVAAEKPELIFRSIIPVVMAGILGMYGMIIAIIMKSNRKYQLTVNLTLPCLSSQRGSPIRLQQPRSMGVRLLPGLQTTWRWTFSRPFLPGIWPLHRCLRRSWRLWH